MTSYTDPAGIVTQYTYDKIDRLLSTMRCLKNGDTVVSSTTVSQTYTWDGQIASKTDARHNTTNYAYDAQGNQTMITDALTKVTLKAYDLLGRNTAIVSPNNYKQEKSLSEMERTEFVYDSMNRVTAQKELYYKMIPDGAGNINREWADVTVKEYEYDSLGNVKTEKDALGNTKTTVYNLAGLEEYETDAETRDQGLPFTVSYAYNGLGQKVKETYPDIVYTYEYDGVGNLLCTKADDVTKSSAEYDFLGRAVKLTDARSNVTTQKWNALGKLSKVVKPDLGTTTYQYDLLGNTISLKNNSAVTVYAYDYLGRTLSCTVKNLAGDVTTDTYYTYDENGNILSKTDGNKKTTNFTYDALNRKETEKNPKLQTTTYTYDANGNELKKEDYLGNTTTKVYDGINRLVETRDAYEKIIQRLSYNNANVQTSSFDALNHETQYLYDKNLRQTGTIDGEQHTSSMTYDTRGNVISRTDGRENTTSYQYDGEGHLTKVTDPRGNSTRYTYDAAGNLLSQTDGNNNTTTYQYNNMNLVETKTDPEGNKETYHYDYNGQMTNKVDRNLITTVFCYDSLGRLTSQTPGGSYTYDANSNLLTTTDSTGTTTRTYDELNRCTSKTVPDIGQSTYEYDLPAETDGEYKERTTDPKGNVTVKTYDKAGRLSKVTVGSNATVYEYNANGTRSKVIYPGSITENYTYNRNNQVTNLTNKKADGTEISSYQYTYDEAGNQKTKAEAKGTTTYTYDNLNRLESVAEPDGKKTTYTYDGAGNRKTEQIEKGLVSSVTIYAYDTRNRLTSTLSSDGTETRYLYDNNGNLIQKTTGELLPVNTSELTAADLPGFELIIRHGWENGTGSDQLISYTYDQENRLIQTKTGNTTSTYSYNIHGLRVSKKVNNRTTRYLYEGDKVVLETDENNVQKAFQAYGINLLYRSTAADGELSAQSYYYLYNAHGDVTALTDTSGNTAVTYDYDAFGTIINQTGTTNNSIKYAGYQQDEESGLYYLNARYYDSVTARFITEDTYTGQKNDPLSLNLYTYCENRPIKYTDPSGHRVVYDTASGSSNKNNKTNTTSNSKKNTSSNGDSNTKNKKGTSSNETSNKEKVTPTPKPTVTPKKETNKVETKKDNTANTGSTGKKDKTYSQANAGSIALPGTGVAGSIALPGTGVAGYVTTTAVETTISNAFGFILSKVCIPLMIIAKCDSLTAVHTDPGLIDEKEDKTSLSETEDTSGAQGAENTNQGSEAGKIELPKNPDDLLNEGWKEVTDPRNTSGSRDFINPQTGEKVRFDPGKQGANGWEGKDHYHRDNPDSTGKSDYYLDVNGNPVPRGSNPSHIPPK